MNPDQFSLWKSILTVSDNISDAVNHKKMNKQDLAFQLNAIEEVFEKTIDPSEDFQGYVILHLCKSLKKSIQQL